MIYLFSIRTALRVGALNSFYEEHDHLLAHSPFLFHPMLQTGRDSRSHRLKHESILAAQSESCGTSASCYLARRYRLFCNFVGAQLKICWISLFFLKFFIQARLDDEPGASAADQPLRDSPRCDRAGRVGLRAAVTPPLFCFSSRLPHCTS